MKLLENFALANGLNAHLQLTISSTKHLNIG